MGAFPVREARMVTWEKNTTCIYAELNVCSSENSPDMMVKHKGCIDLAMTASDLCSWSKALQGFRFSESLVDVSPVLHFLLVGEEIQSAFSTAMDPLFL